MVLWFSLFLWCHWCSADEPLGLFDCYRLALKRSEQIEIQEELIHQAEANFKRSFSGILPRVSYVFKELREDGIGTTPERKWLVTQPLFRGFKEFAAMSGTRAFRKQREYEKERAEQLLFLDVSDAFYQRLEFKNDLKILIEIRKIVERQVRELGTWVRIGRSRPSELAMTKSQLKKIEAEITKAKRLLTVSKEVLAFLTGVSIQSLSEERWEWNSSETVSDFLKAIRQRPDLLAKQEEIEVAKANLKAARADLFPTVSLEANSYDERSGSKSKVDWDLLLTVDIPIFEGGEVWSKVKEQRSVYHQTELETQETRRQAESEVRSAYEQFQFSLAEQKALREAVEASQENYLLQEQDYRLKLVTYLTVLSSLRDSHQAKRELNHVACETKRDFWNLKVVGASLDR